MSRPEILLFGAPQIVVDRHPIQIGSNKALAMLAYMAVQGAPVSRDSLATLFWPDYGQTRARAYLRQAIWTVNRATGEDWFSAESETITLRPGLSVDTRVFSEMIDLYRNHHHSPDPICADCLSHLEQAARLYRADFLAGLTLRDCPEFDIWQSFQAEHFRQASTEVFSSLTQEWIHRTVWEKAIETAQRWLMLDPLHEPAHRQMMKIYAASGQRAAALNHYEKLRQLLESEMGVEPEPESLGLFEAIRSENFSSAAGPAPVSSSTPSAPRPTPGFLKSEEPNMETPSGVFVGREEELEKLNHRLQSAMAGKGQMVFIAGEAGTGKTTLLSEFARRSEQAYADLLITRGNCNAFFGIGDPYLPFREILTTLSGDVESHWAAGEISRQQAQRIWETVPDTRDILQSEGPNLIDVLIPTSLIVSAENNPYRPLVKGIYEQAGVPPRGMGKEFAQTLVFDEITRVFHSLANRRPLLMLLDDLQWADNTSISLLFHLVRKITGSRILILGAYRPSDIALGRSGAASDQSANPHPLEPVLQELKRYYGDIVIDLGKSKPNDGKRFIQELLNSEPNQLDDVFREALYRHTKGHPLFTIELLREIQDRGVLVKNEAGKWVQGSELDWETIPARVEAVIEQRFNRLDATLIELLSIASIEGEEFTVDVIAHVQKMDVRQVLNHLSQKLERLHRLVSERGEQQIQGRAVTRYQFGHVLFQQYLYHRLSAGERRLLHGEVARALEALYGSETDEIATQLAHHYSEAGEPELASAYLLRSGDQARQRMAHIEAIDFYQAAVRAWAPDDPAGYANALCKLGEGLWILGRIPEALDRFMQALHLYEKLEYWECAGSTERQVGRMYWEAGQRDLSLQHYHRALAILEEMPENVELARAVSSISQMHMLASHFDEAIAWGERALSLASRLGVEDVALHAQNNIGTSYLMLGELERGQSMLLQSRDRALALGLPHDVCRAYSNLSEGLTSLCRYDEAHHMFTEYLTYAEKVHAELFYQTALTRISELEWLLGRWQSAIDRMQPLIRRLMDDEHELPSPWGIWACTIAGQMYLDLGQPAAALKILEKRLAQARRVDELQTTAPFLGALFSAYASLGSETEARETRTEFREWIDRSPYFDRNSLMPLLSACIWVSREDTSPQSETEAYLALLEKADRQIHSLETNACLAEAQGNWLLAQGNETARDLFQVAQTKWETLNRPYDQIRVLRKLGETFRSSGEKRAAHDVYRQAIQLASHLRDQLKEKELRVSFWRSPLISSLHRYRIFPWPGYSANR